VSRIELQTLVAAPRERCFDLSLSVELHLQSAAESSERVVAGPTSGLLRLGDEITWEAHHLGRTRRLTMTISAYDRPRMFRDELVRGPFRRLTHDHYFEENDGVTTMTDVFVFASIFPPVDPLIVKPHLRRFLLERNRLIRELAEASP
jgi:ligand-binding SRPBCC domain-containing protein